MSKVVVITGGDRGIGAACVRLFCSEGHRVIFFYKARKEEAEKLKQEMLRKGYQCDFLACDLTSEDNIKSAFEKIIQNGHRIDILVNNAAVADIRQIQDYQLSELHNIFDVNLFGMIQCIQQAIPTMISQKRGSIINVTSMWGEVGASCESVYSASKAAVIGLTKSLAKELGPSGIRVNCVSPGVIDTDMNKSIAEEVKMTLIDETPLGRLGMPMDIAEAVLFLSGDHASYITGEVLRVNGGYII